MYGPSSKAEPVAPLVMALPWRAPHDVFRQIAPRRLPAWLDSAGPLRPRSRFSYLCADPVWVLDYRQGVLREDGLPCPERPFDALQARLARWRRPVPATGPVPFMGGAVGLLGYALGAELERLPAAHRRDPELPDLWVGFYDLLLGFDHQTRRCWLVSTGLHPAGSAGARAALMLGWLAEPPALLVPLPPVRWQAELSRPRYEAMIRRTLDYVGAGDIFQANLTMRHVAARPAGLDPASLQLALRARSPAAFGAYLGWGEGTGLCSVSPERFLSLDPDRMIETRPIKGTRPRSADARADRQAARDLAASVKDRAENLMIVDLMRNDLSRVAVTGSVSVPSLFEVESIATLHHLVSTVTARLRPDQDAVSLLKATFPGGSVTGAPKIRAMQIIDALEASARGPYTGSVFWIGLDGAMDSNIVIRTLLLTSREVIAQAGGGIVSDSVPGDEYREMLSKVDPLLSVLR